MATIFKNIRTDGTSALRGQVTCGIGVNTYTMPQTRGIANQTLISNGVGAAVWATAGAGILYTSSADVSITSTAPLGANYILTTTSSTVATWQPLSNIVQTSYEYRLLTSTANPTAFAALTTDNYIGCNSAAGVINLTLPTIASFTGGKKVYVIVDAAGVANGSGRRINILAGAGNTINGAASAAISTARASLSIFSNTTNNWIIF
jgi:hypothetical protein